MKDFVHWHLHTIYSILDGQCKIEPLVLKARQMGMKAIAVTDHGNLFALKAFFDACRSEKGPFGKVPKIKPILGCEAYVTSTGDCRSRDKSERRHHLCLHAKNKRGYHNLVRLISEAHVHGFYSKPRIDRSLLERYHEGLHCSSACVAGEVPEAIADGRMDEAVRIAQWYKDLFGDDYSLEVMLHKSTKTGRDVPAEAQSDFRRLYERQCRIVKGSLALGRKLGIRVIATNDVHFLGKDDDDSHDVLLAISTGARMEDAKRMIYSGEEYFKSGDEMAALFAECPEVISNTLEAAERIEAYDIDAQKAILPKFEIPASFTDEDEYLASLVWEGARKRWGQELSKEATERITFELDTIRKMGFSGYFLIVHDYIAAAKEMGVWVGPGRGSAAGSAVAYTLGITNVDPLRFDLLFERFLNPDRISMPDIDVDFDDAGRERVIDYVTAKYGSDHVAHIVTFNQLAAKMAIKDVGRVMGYPLSKTNKLAALVPDVPKITLEQARIESKELDEAFRSDDPFVRKLLERAAKVEGSIRQSGVHACGIIISRDPLIETLPVMQTPQKGKKAEDGGDRLLTTQYDGHYVEPVGLLKMDFLGLKTLTVEKECVELLKARGIPLDPDTIPEDDKATYELFGRGETTGLFQFESEEMKSWLKALKPERLADLVAMNALYRPGPMDYIPTFVRRKQGQESVKYDHPLMERYLKDTYGVTVYQEQVMLQSRLLAGFTRGESDSLRKAIGKKDEKRMDALRGKFFEGCLANPEFRVDKWKDEGTAKELIGKIWGDWVKFAKYAFNKSHAVCYAWVAYQTGYMKAHYPAEFMCAQISSEIGNFEKLPGFIAEAQAMGLKMALPDVNESGARFVPTQDGTGIRYGLGGIKGVGKEAARKIVEEREKNGLYSGFLDFCVRLFGSRVLNSRVLECLVRSGAFSTLDPNRAKLLTNIDFALKKAAVIAKERSRGQTSFFALDKVDEGELADGPALSPIEYLRSEKELLGEYLSAHPMDYANGLVSRLATLKARDFADVKKMDARLRSVPEGQFDKWRQKGNRPLTDPLMLARLEARTVGMLTDCKVKPGKVNEDGKPGGGWALMEIDDGTGKICTACYAKTWERCAALADKVGELVLVEGEVSHRVEYDGADEATKRPRLGALTFRVKDAQPLETALPRLSESFNVRLSRDDTLLMEKVKQIAALCERHKGRSPLFLELAFGKEAIVTIDLGPTCRAAITLPFLAELSAIVPINETRIN